MTNYAWIESFVTSVALGLPLLIAFVATVLWELWARPADPPRFAAYDVRQGWKVDPVAVVADGLRRGRSTEAIVMLHDRLVDELTDHHRLTPREILGSNLAPRPKGNPWVERACRTVVALEATYRLAHEAEDPARTDVWSAWRRPLWRARVREQYARELAAVEDIWPHLVASS